MDSHAAIIQSGFDSHLHVIEAARTLETKIAEAGSRIRTALQSGSKILFCGNGGSAADAQHLAAEFVGRFVKDRGPMPAIALHANTSTLTAVANDFGYDTVFEREVRAFGIAGDVLVAISTSGNSPSIVNAAEAAKRQGLTVIAMTGATGGRLGTCADVLLNVPSEITARIQEAHILMGHVLCEIAEA